VKLLQYRSPEASHLLFFEIVLETVLKIFLKKLSGRFNVFIISKRQSSLRNKFYDRNHRLHAEAISNIVGID